MTDQLSSGTTKVCPACAEDIKVDAAVCRYCGQEFLVHRVGYCNACHGQVEVAADHVCPTCGSTVIDVVVSSEAAQPSGPVAPPAAPAVPAVAAPPPTSPPASVTAPTPTRRSGGGLAAKLVIGSVAVVVIVIGALFVGTQLNGEAPSPRDLSDQFSQAGVSCTTLEKIVDTRDVKTLGCVSQDAQIITVFTYADPPSQSEFVRNLCAVSTSKALRSGALVVGDDFVIEIVQGAHPSFVTPPTPKAVANRLADAVGGSVTTFNCDTSPGS